MSPPPVLSVVIDNSEFSAWSEVTDNTPGGDTVTVISPTQGTTTDRSGSIALGSNSQALMGANTARNYLFIQNTGSNDIWFNFSISAVIGQPSMKLQPGGAFVMEGSFVSTEAMFIIGATTAQVYTAKEG